jgi:type II secretory pathway pseudopilin PulG
MTKTDEKTNTDRRKLIKYGIADAIGVGVASAIELPVLNNQIQNDNSQITQLKNQVSTLQSQLSSATQQEQAIKTLSINEVKEVEAMVETITPSDQNGPSAKEAGVIYFIDRQLSG